MAETGKRAERRRAERGDDGGSDMKGFYVILAVVAVVGLGILAYNLGSGAFGSAAAEPVEVEGLDDPTRLVQLAEGIPLGDPDAPVTIMEFADYQCPACRVFASQTMPQVKAGLVETGEARFVFYDFPLIESHPNAFLAARAARCAGAQDGYWEYHDKLYQEQGSWASASSPAGEFVGYAEEVGLDPDDFEGCLRSDRFADVVSANRRLALELRIPGTPSVLVRGQGMPLRVQTSTYDTYGAIEAAVRQVQGEGDPAAGDTADTVGSAAGDAPASTPAAPVGPRRDAGG